MAVAIASKSGVARNATASSVTITKPASLAVGDLMIAHLARSDNDTTARAWATLAGWTLIDGGDDNDGGSSGYSYSAQYKVADSGDVAASNFTFSLSSGTSDELAGHICRLTGISPANPVNAGDGTHVNNDETPSFNNTITPSVASCMLLILASHAGGGTSKTTGTYAIATDNPSWTEEYDDHSSTSLTLAGASATRTQTTATGNSSFVSSGDATTDCQCIIVAVQPTTDVTVSPSVLVANASVQAPTIQYGVNLSVSVVTANVSVQSPSISEKIVWSNTSKSSSPTWTNQDKSST